MMSEPSTSLLASASFAVFCFQIGNAFAAFMNVFNVFGNIKRFQTCTQIINRSDIQMKRSLTVLIYYYQY